MSGFTGSVTAAPTPIVDDVGPCFTVAVPPVAPPTGGDLLADPLTSSDGWTTASGTPTFTDGLFTGGYVKRTLSGAPRRIVATAGTTITASDSLNLFFWFTGVATFYRLQISSTAVTLLKIGSNQGSYAYTVQADDEIEIVCPATGNIEVKINGTTQITAAVDESYVDNTEFRINTGGSGAWAVNAETGTLDVYSTVE